MNGEFDDHLRRALHAEVAAVEPAADGLARIQRRTRQPWLLRQLSLMVTDCADLFWLIAVRLEPRADKLWAAIVARTGLLAAPAGRRHAAPGRRARPGSRLAWLRPVLAVSAAVIVVAAGVYGLAQLRQSLVLDLFPNAGAPAGTSPGAANGSRAGGSVQGHTSPTGLLPAISGRSSATPSPHPTCTRSAEAKQSPTPTGSPTPTPSGSPSGSPTPTPTATATATASTTAFIATTSEVSQAGRCTQVRSAK